MQQVYSASQQSGLRTRLTDPVTIATAAELLLEAGYTELAIWRHFMEAFAVDLDALSLIMIELFGAARAPRQAAQAAAPARREASARLRAA